MTEHRQTDRYLDQLRKWRNPPQRDNSLSFLADEDRKLKRLEKQLGQFVDAWLQVVPEPLVHDTAIIAYQRGTLKVAVRNSAALYQLDRLIRTTVIQQLRQHVKAPLRNIRTELGDPALFQSPED